MEIAAPMPRVPPVTKAVLLTFRSPWFIVVVGIHAMTAAERCSGADWHNSGKTARQFAGVA
jgi:hypothetical protein